MSLYLVLKLVHVVGAAVLLGTGSGIAFFMLMAHRTGDARLIAHTADVVVVADTVFTATTMVVQPVTDAVLARLSGLPLSHGWIAASLGLYVAAGALWLPVVWMQLRMRDLARAAVAGRQPLPLTYHRLWRTWFAFGLPAFAAVTAIFWLMIAKPDI